MAITFDSEPRKKSIPMCILEILQRYSDESHPVTQKIILEKLKSEYGFPTIERKAVARNLELLIECGYELEIVGTPSTMKVKNKYGETLEKTKLTNFYLVRDFTDSELRLILDSLLFSKNIPANHLKELSSKITAMSSKYFASHVSHIKTYAEKTMSNKQLFSVIDVLDEAIGSGKKVAFKYCHYETDKKLHPKKNSDGKDSISIINPYQMVIANGRYYLICNYDKYDNIAHLRIDRIKDITLLDEAVKPLRSLPEAREGLYLPKHMAEHIYMFSGESTAVTFSFKKYLINDIIDWFGNDIQFIDGNEDEITARVTVNLKAMKLWATQYACHAKVISPPSLVEEVRNDLMYAMKNYGL